MNVDTLRTYDSANALIYDLGRNNIDIACIHEKHNDEIIQDIQKLPHISWKIAKTTSSETKTKNDIISIAEE